MEIGTTIISTAEYMELRAMKDNLEARKAEIEENADKVFVNDWSRPYTSQHFLPKDEAIRKLGDEVKRLNDVNDALQSAITTLSIEVQKNDPAKIDRSLSARLHFLFTGNLRKE